jgi:hypothetical protein
MAEKNMEPQWQPIERLPLFAHLIASMLQGVQEQYENLQQARPKPHVLDDYTVGRVISVFTVQQKDLSLFDEQLRRWQAGKLSTTQSKEIERLVGQMKQLREVITAILALAAWLKERTIEKVMAKSDAELGLEFLLDLTDPERQKGKQ